MPKNKLYNPYYPLLLGFLTGILFYTIFRIDYFSSNNGFNPMIAVLSFIIPLFSSMDTTSDTWSRQESDNFTTFLLALWGFAISTSYIAVVFAICLSPVVLMVYLKDSK